MVQLPPTESIEEDQIIFSIQKHRTENMTQYLDNYNFLCYYNPSPRSKTDKTVLFIFKGK